MNALDKFCAAFLQVMFFVNLGVWVLWGWRAFGGGMLGAFAMLCVGVYLVTVWPNVSRLAARIQSDWNGET